MEPAHPTGTVDGNAPGRTTYGVASSAVLPRARLAVMPSCGHFAYLEASEVVHGEIAAFIRGA